MTTKKQSQLPKKKLGTPETKHGITKVLDKRKKLCYNICIEAIVKLTSTTQLDDNSFTNPLDFLRL